MIDERVGGHVEHGARAFSLRCPAWDDNAICFLHTRPIAEPQQAMHMYEGAQLPASVDCIVVGHVVVVGYDRL